MNRVIITARNSEFPRFGAVRPSGMKPEAVAPTVSGRSKPAKTLHTVKRSECSVSPRPAATPAPKAQPRGTSLADKAIDVVTVIGGLAVFGMIAMFFMVLA